MDEPTQVPRMATIMKPQTTLYLSRKQSGLSQRDLAVLLHVSPQTVSALEADRRDPSLAIAFGIELVFGHPARTVFTGHYDKLENKLMRRAATLFEEMETKHDSVSKSKREFLLKMIERGTSIATPL